MHAQGRDVAIGYAVRYHQDIWLVAAIYDSRPLVGIRKAVSLDEQVHNASNTNKFHAL